MGIAQKMFRYFTAEKCQHPTFYETMACDAVCMDCGKNLGFIGNLDRSKCVAGNDPDRWNMRPNLEKS